ncbi:uncharacterized protein SCHCODRAFT_02519256, partial [Schizophyllum commune H4-8]|uniref:uncharacterized protein n=1 Tax=Schizophyllum commune (strain H4-8 / FGSC 9210) TaxID=578458 RepID=UPI00215EFEC2
RRHPLLIAPYDPLSTVIARASSVAPPGPYLRPHVSRLRASLPVCTSPLTRAESS